MNSLQLSLWKNPISEKAFDDCINCSTGTSESPNNTLVRIFFSKIQLIPKVQTSAHHSLLLPLYSVPIHIYRMEQQQFFPILHLSDRWQTVIKGIKIIGSTTKRNEIFRRIRKIKKLRVILRGFQLFPYHYFFHQISF